MINNRLTRSGLTSPAEVLRGLGLNVGDDQRAADRVPAARSRTRAGRDETERPAGSRPRRTQSSTPLSVGRGDWRPDPVRAAIVS
jgi:hypothetical protein